MALYTFFLEYEGGTYISQVRATREDLATKVWASEFKLAGEKKYRKFFEANFQKKLLASLDLNLISPIEGVKNTWDFSAYTLDKPATIHFTKTVDR
jgi:hypothetical protein